jgi:hypothetical protein
MADSWNFYDPDDVSSIVGSCLAQGSHLPQHLIKVKFMDQVKKFAQLATPDEAEAKSWFKRCDLR